MMNSDINYKILSLFEDSSNKLSIYCDAVYFGGSRVDPIIENPQDYDYICFATPLCKHHLLRTLSKEGLRILGSTKKSVIKSQKHSNYNDFSQVRVYPYTQITWFSYLDVLMTKVVGKEVCPKTDIIREYRKEFFIEIYKKMQELNTGVIKNQKRWYHLLRSIYILINNSYEVTKEQKHEINVLHQLAEGWEEIRDKTIQLIETFAKENNY